MNPETVRRRSKKAETAASGSLLLGLLVGYLVESNTNDVAREKIQTVQECVVDVAPQGLSPEQVDCTSRSDSDGNQRIDPDKLSIGDSASTVESYVESQRTEAEKIELGRMLFWGVAGSSELLTLTLIFQAITD